MKFKNLLFPSIFIFLFFTCKEIDHTLIHGKWKGAAMLEKGKLVDKGAELIEFNFLPNKTYSFTNSINSEAGPWRTLEDKLYTQDTLNPNHIEKVVRITNLTADSLFIEMNAGGVQQLLKCYKVK